MKLPELLKESRTAFYVLDPAEAKRRISLIRDSLSGNISVAYAVKADPFLVGGLIGAAERFEICSPGESMICDTVGVPPEKTVISGVYKDPEFIEKTVASSDGRIYTAESLRQFDLLCELGKKYGKRLKMLLRLTNGSQFGINAEEIEDIVSRRESFAAIELLGIQFFSGTQKTSLKKLSRELRDVDALLFSLREKYDFVARELEYGPGFPVDYFEDDADRERELLSGFRDILCSVHGAEHVILELGRSIAASSGKYYTHIVDMKRNSGQNYLIVDGGMHQIVYFGQYMGMKIPRMSVCGKENMPPEENWNICGALCSMNDILAKDVPLPPVSVGDVLCFENAGAYCMTEGCALFLSRDLPGVYIAGESGELACARKQTETYLFNIYCN